MRTRITLLCTLSALSLAACQKPDNGSGPGPKAERGAAPGADAATSAPAAQAGQASAPIAPPALSIPQLAYVYKYALAAPPKEVRHLVSKHEAVCWAAGPTVCQVTGSNVTEDGPDKVGATLTLRAQPAWLRTFRAGLEDDTKAVGGRMVTTDTASDDLSRTIVDTEAALKAKTTLRDRLQETLRTRTGKVQDFFEMEQQLAEEQGQIDATRSELAIMKTPVATSELRIDYRSEGVFAPRGTFRPVGQAASDVAGIFIGTLAFLIRALAVIVPMAGVGGLLFWLIRLANRKPVKTPSA